MSTALRLAAAAATVLVVAAQPFLSAEIIEQVLVKVNGEIFTKSDLETRQIAALRQMQQNTPNDQELRKLLNEITPQLIVSAVDEMLIVQRGTELGYRLGDEQFDGILDGLKKDNKIENDEQFQAALKQEGMTLAELRRNIERQMIVSRVQQNEVLGRVAVSDEEAREYYKSHLSEFTSAQTVTLREVLVAVPTGGAPSLDAAAKQKAEAIRARAVAGESFEKLASEESEAPSRANAGLIGPLNLADVSAELQQVIKSLKVGEVSPVLKSAGGYQVLKLESLTTPEVSAFEAVSEDVKNRIFAEKRRVEALRFLERLRADAIIEWKNDDLKKAYDLGLQQQKSEPASLRSH
jgi:parvulin-like peptidyl-prolyl isomerase